MENTNPNTAPEDYLKVHLGKCDCYCHCLQVLATDDSDTVDLTILTTGSQPIWGRLKEAWRHICHDELNHTGVVLSHEEAWKLVDFLQREFLPPARTDGQTLEMNSKALDRVLDKGPAEHTYWGFEPEYLREPDCGDDPTKWFNTLKEAQEFRGKHNILAKLAKDDLKILGLPLDASDLVDSPDRYGGVEIEEWDKATLKLAKKLSIVAPDFDRGASYAACYIPKHVGAEFRSKHVNLTVDGVRELL